LRTGPSRFFSTDNSKKEEEGEGTTDIINPNIAEISAKYFPLHNRGNNAFDLMYLLDCWGIGWRIIRQNWIGKEPESYWIVTRVKMTNRNRRIWGKFIWKGQMQNEGKEMQIIGAHKRLWRLKEPDPSASSLRPTDAIPPETERALIEVIRPSFFAKNYVPPSDDEERKTRHVKVKKSQDDDD